MHQLLGVPPSEAQQAQYAAAAENSKSRCGAENSLIGRRGGRISMEISSAPSSTNVHDMAVPERSTSRAGMRGLRDKPSPRSSTQKLNRREQNLQIKQMKMKPPPSHRKGYVRFKLARYQSTALVLKVPSSAGTQQLQLQDTWKLDPPQLLGGSPARVRRLGPADPRPRPRGHVEKASQVARSTNTWVMTGGMDGGVVQFAGKATGLGAARHCIASWLRVRDKEVIEHSFKQQPGRWFVA